MAAVLHVSDPHSPPFMRIASSAHGPSNRDPASAPCVALAQLPPGYVDPEPVSEPLPSDRDRQPEVRDNRRHGLCRRSGAAERNRAGTSIGRAAKRWRTIRAP